MSKVFIAGASGFIGSELSSTLLNRGHDVYALCRNVTDRKITLPGGVKIVSGNLIDGHFLRKAIQDIRPDAVVHLAAPSSVYYSHTHPQENFEVTILGTLNLQQACIGQHVKRFIYAGTSEEYGNQKKLPIRETSELRPNQPYAIAKVAADQYLQYCKDSAGFPAIVARPFNTFGRAKNFTFVTESIIHQMLTQDKVILGDPNPVRDFMYVDDHVNAYVKLLETEKDLSEYRAFNFCTGVGTSIKTLANKIKKYTEFEGKIQWNVKTRPTEIDELVGDWNLAFNVLGWRPEYTLDEGLVLTIEKMREILDL